MRYQENPQSRKISKGSTTKKTLILKYNIKKRYQQNAEIDKKYQKHRYQENKKSCDKVDSFLQQVKQGPYYICTICHRSLYQRSVRLCKHEKYNILMPELYHPVKSLDEKLYICETYHKHLNKNEIHCQAVCDKMTVDPILNELKDIKN